EHRRLRELERLGLAAPLDASRWRIAPNLLERLQQEPTTTAHRHRLVLQKQPVELAAQVHHPGPAWLDRIPAADLAPYGLGAELQRLVAQRREVLRKLGIEPDAPNRMAKLRDLEVRAIGREIAARSGQAFLPAPPTDFRGRVQVLDSTGAGHRY